MLLERFSNTLLCLSGQVRAAESIPRCQIPSRRAQEFELLFIAAAYGAADQMQTYTEPLAQSQLFIQGAGDEVGDLFAIQHVYLLPPGFRRASHDADEC